MISIQDNFPIYSVFLLILIISGAPLFELFSCKIRSLFENIIFTHLLAYLTLVFFIVITIPTREKHILKIIPQSTILYAFFLGLIKTSAFYFVSILGIITTIYILVLYKAELLDSIDSIRIRIVEEDTNLAENEKKIKMLSETAKSALTIDHDLKNEPTEIKDIKEQINNIVLVNNSLFVVIVPLYIIGIYLHMQSKIKKYKSNFSIFKFFLYKSKCK